MSQTTLYEWIVTIEADGGWFCEHCDRQGNVMPSTRLTIKEAQIENPNDSPNRQRGHVWCPDCGTYWRVWKDLRLAKQYVAPPLVKMVLPTARYRRLRSRDVDQILAALRESIPELEVTQYQQSWPADDDGIWFFHVLAGKNIVQIESPTGYCPFLIEDDVGKEARSGATVAGVVAQVLELLRL